MSGKPQADAAKVATKKRKAAECGESSSSEESSEPDEEMRKNPEALERYFKDKLEAERKKRKAERKKRKESEYSLSLRRMLKEPPEIKLRKKGNSKSHTSTNHNKAKCEERPIVLEEIPELDDSIKSSLLVYLTTQHEGELMYSTERDISQLISLALVDALGLVKHTTGRALRVHHEYSLFSNRPDHLVVVDETHDPVVVVEDKPPTDDPLPSYPRVCGQVFDYLMAMKAFGHTAPFAVLTSYKDSCLCWLPDESSDTLASASSEERHSQVENSQPETAGSPGPSSTFIHKTPSPPELTRDEQGIATPPTDSGFKKLSDGNEAINVSVQHDSNQLIMLLYTCVLCGLARNPGATKRRIQETRDKYQGKVLKFDKSNYVWGELTVVNNNSKIYEESTGARLFSRSGSGTYYAIGTIGRGSTSRVFEAFDHMGCRCAVKMFVERDESETKESFDERAKEACDCEVQRLKKLYRAMENRVSVQTLKGFSCVVMPLLTPLSKEERQSPGVKSQIEAILGKMFSMNLKYKECDLKWRHIGKMDDGRIVMFDLADLEVVGETEVESDVVAEHWQTLQNRLPEAEEAEQALGPL